MRLVVLICFVCALSFPIAGCHEEEPAYLPGRNAPASPLDAPTRAEREARAAEIARLRASSPHGAPRAEEPNLTPIPAPPDVAAPPADAARLPSGLASRVLAPGTGRAHPGLEDGVRVNYTGWRAENGEMFDSSVARGDPIAFTLDRVIPGWREGVALMVEGERRRLWIPASLAYEGRGGPQGMLVFDVELLDIYPLAAPANVATPPPGAQRSASGLAWVVLRPGQGDRHPARTDHVTVHYAGWRAENGELFDTSVRRGRAAEFQLDGVIPGWTEVVQLMVPGERRRVWIPASLAYEGRQGPQGTLVFDIHLLAIR